MGKASATNVLNHYGRKSSETGVSVVCLKVKI